jgi:tryptophan halogenase
VFASAFTDEDAARETLLSNIEGAPLAEPRLLRFRAGRRDKAWVKNCLALGLAGGFLEPLESTSVHLIQSGIAHFLTMFPDRDLEPAEIERYNRIIAFETERVRDFLILHYRCVERNDTPFWRHCRDLCIPDSLSEKIDLFLGRGRIFRENEELFSGSSWFAVMVGQGLSPRGYDPLVDVLSPADTRRRMAQIRAGIANSVDLMPMHGDFIAQHFVSEAMD